MHLSDRYVATHTGPRVATDEHTDMRAHHLVASDNGMNSGRPVPTVGVCRVPADRPSMRHSDAACWPSVTP
jgi:hypothetical protein